MPGSYADVIFWHWITTVQLIEFFFSPRFLVISGVCIFCCWEMRGGCFSLLYNIFHFCTFIFLQQTIQSGFHVCMQSWHIIWPEQQYCLCIDSGKYCSLSQTYINSEGKTHLKDLGFGPGLFFLFSQKKTQLVVYRDACLHPDYLFRCPREAQFKCWWKPQLVISVTRGPHGTTHSLTRCMTEMSFKIWIKYMRACKVCAPNFLHF